MSFSYANQVSPWRTPPNPYDEAISGYPANEMTNNPPAVRALLADYSGGGGGGYGGGGGGGGPARYGAAPGGGPGGGILGGGSGYDPAVTLGPDGNLYGYLRTYDAATGGYGYRYSNFGPASNLAGASAASGIPVGMLQQAVTHQGIQNSQDAYQMSAGPGTGGQTRLAYGQGTQDITDPYNRTQAVYNSANQSADLHLRDLNRQYDTTAGAYNTGTAAYTGGQTRQQYVQGTQDLQNPYNRSDAAYKLANQPQQQALESYRQGLQTQQAQTTGQSRDLQGVGWAGIQRPIIAGT